MTRRLTDAPRDAVWEAFAARHSGHPFLQLDPLYALTEDVIDAVQLHIADFFTADNERFERDLARTAGNGFFLRRLISGTTPAPQSRAALAERPGLTIEQFLEERDRVPEASAVAQAVAEQLAPILKPEWLPDGRLDRALRAIDEMIAALTGKHAPTARGHAATHARQREAQRSLHQRLEAYVGWLVTNPHFRAELRALRAAHGKAVALRGGFPVRPGLAAHGTARQRAPRPGSCVAACLSFYKRWSLERLLTWDVPVPMEASLSVLMAGELELPAEEGAVLFFPWYLLRGSRLDLRQLGRRLRLESPAHLRGWVLQGTGGPRAAAGDRGYQLLIWLYRCELALARYPKACARNVERLDEALAEVIKPGQETVRKLRQRLARALRQHRGRGGQS